MGIKIASSTYPNVNVPNALTIFRIVLIPVFAGFYLWGTTREIWIALAVFMLASFTDQLDGHIARSKGLITNFGKLADPIADKALTLTAFVLLSIRGPVPYFWVFTVLVAIREIGITVLREVLRRGGTVVAASSGGKLKTVLQMGLIVWMMIPWRSFLASDTVWNWIIGAIIAWAAVTLVVTVVSGLQYCIAAWRSSRSTEE